MVTLQEIAERAGVSTATVSRALSGKGRVAQSTRKRILEIAHSLGYSPPKNQEVTVSVFYSGRLRSVVDDTFYGAVLEGIEREASRLGARVVFSSLPDDPRRAVAGSLPDQCGGAIIIGADVKREQIQWLMDAGLPLVLVDNQLPEGDVDAVVINNRQGMRLIVSHLAELGHRAIAYVGGPQHHTSLRQRYQAFVEHLGALSLELRSELVQIVEDVDYSFITGQVGADRLLGTGLPFTAVVCDNDDVAAGVIQELVSKGIAVPADVSVTGFDGRDVQFRPRLTTVEVARTQIGAMAFSRLDQLMKGDHTVPTTITVSTRLMVNESTARPVGTF